MTGLSEEYRPVIWRLLDYIPDGDIISLATTVSRGMVSISTVEEARNAILSFSDSVESILKRKKVKQEHLVKFLWDKKIEMSEGTEKQLLIKHFIHHLPLFVNQCSSGSGPSRREQSETSGTSIQTSNPQNSSSQFNTAFVEQFIPWYIDSFNNGPPAFGPHHFWSDSELSVFIRQRDDGNSLCLNFNGADEVSQHLMNLHSAGMRLASSPNPSPSSSNASMDGFGRVIVKFSGCVHHAFVGGPAGLFMQMMGLIQEVPSDSSSSSIVYKIKFLKLEIETQLHPQVFCGNSVTE